MDSKASDNSQTDTNPPERNSLLGPITGPKEGVQLSMDDMAPSQLPEGESAIPEQPKPQPDDEVPYHCKEHLPEVICFVHVPDMECRSEGEHQSSKTSCPQNPACNPTDGDKVGLGQLKERNEVE